MYLREPLIKCQNLSLRCNSETNTLGCQMLIVRTTLFSVVADLIMNGAFGNVWDKFQKRIPSMKIMSFKKNVTPYVFSAKQ